MKAKDTVMKMKEVQALIKEWEELPFGDAINLDDYINQAQMEISFKAGREEEHKVMVGIAVDEGNKAHVTGRKEVVDWIYDNNGQPDHILDLWEAQLKEWGINED